MDGEEGEEGEEGGDRKFVVLEGEEVDGSKLRFTLRKWGQKVSTSSRNENLPSNAQVTARDKTKEK